MNGQAPASNLIRIPSSGPMASKEPRPFVGHRQVCRQDPADEFHQHRLERLAPHLYPCRRSGGDHCHRGATTTSSVLPSSECKRSQRDQFLRTLAARASLRRPGERSLHGCTREVSGHSPHHWSRSPSTPVAGGSDSE
jgi:hypothetical protein